MVPSSSVACCIVWKGTNDCKYCVCRLVYWLLSVNKKHLNISHITRIGVYNSAVHKLETRFFGLPKECTFKECQCKHLEQWWNDHREQDKNLHNTIEVFCKKPIQYPLHTRTNELCTINITSVYACYILVNCLVWAFQSFWTVQNGH